MTENKRFRVTIGNENDVRLVDYMDNRELISISFKDYEDAEDCRDVLLYQCNMMNDLYDENIVLKKKVEFFNELNKPYGELIGEIQRLKKENEQLKGEVEYLENKDRDNRLERIRMINQMMCR